MSRPEPGEVSRVAVIGTGTIGASWAGYFLARGMSVAATDPAPNAEERLFAYVDRAWPVLEELGLVVDGAAIDRLVFEPSVRKAVRAAEFVQENGPELEDAKTDLIAEIDAACPRDTVIASSTSALLMTPLQSKCRHPERCVLAHPFNPPHLIPLVELSGGKATDPAVLDWAHAFYEGIGRSPIRLGREVFGHVANRLQYVVWNEAVRLVLDGVASVADVERAMRDGPGLRWAFTGPFGTLNLTGGEGGLARTFEMFRARDRGNTDRAARRTLTPEQEQVMIDGIDEANGGRDIAEIIRARDARLVGLLKMRAALDAEDAG